MKGLLGWLKRTDAHPLVAGCVFHYELEFIHPFSHRPTFRANYLNPALTSDLIEYTIPGKPQSRLQKFRLTTKGKALINNR